MPPGKAVLAVNVKQLFDLTGRVAIVSGGSMGLGRQMAEGLAEMGANLVLCARKKERCEEAAETLRRRGVHTLALGCDVRDKAAIQQVVEETLAKFGRIDILINNAGVSWGASVDEMTLEQWDKVLSTNLTGTFLFCQAVGKAMEAQASGKIIKIASVQSELARPGIAPYTATKGAVKNLTRGMCADWAKYGLQINAIAPGYFKTPLNQALVDNPEFSTWLEKRTPAARWGNVEELVGAAVFLSGKASSFVNGHTLYVDGGITTSL